MDSIRAGLKDLGVPDDRVYLEMFVKVASAKRPSSPAVLPSDAIAGAEIVFVQS